jgi:hypothetical protein
MALLLPAPGSFSSPAGAPDLWGLAKNDYLVNNRTQRKKVCITRDINLYYIMPKLQHITTIYSISFLIWNFRDFLRRHQICLSTNMRRDKIGLRFRL